MKKKELSEVNKKALEEFVISNNARISNPRTRKTQKSYVKMWMDGIGKDYNLITTRDNNLYFGNLKPTSAEVIKPVIKRFLKFHNLENIADEIITNGRILSKQIKGEESVLTAEEIEKLIEAPEKLSRKALIETFTVTGARRDEIRNLNLADITVTKNIVWVNIRESKTKIRRIPIVPDPDNPVARYPKYLIRWIESRKDDDKDLPLFPSNRHGLVMKRLTEIGLYNIIEIVKKDADITKKVTPHIFRHTGASYDGATLPESMLCQKYGWVVGSNMARRYCHFNEKQLAEQLLKRAGIKEEESTKGRVCPRCGEVNNLFAESCSKCHQILDTKKLMQQVQKEEKEKLKQQQELQTLKQQMEKMHGMLETIAPEWYAKRKDEYEYYIGEIPDAIQLFKEYKEELETLREIKKIGLEQWALKQRENQG